MVATTVLYKVHTEYMLKQEIINQSQQGIWLIHGPICLALHEWVHFLWQVVNLRGNTEE